MTRTMTPKLSDRLSKLIRMLASDKPGEVLSTVNMIKRSLASEKLDLHDLAERLLSDSSCKSTSENEAAAEARTTASWARDYEAARRAEAERYAAEKAAKAAARAAERATPEYKARVAQRWRDALARKAAEAAAEAERAERAEAERKLSDRIAAEGPKWGDIGDAARRAWVSRILCDPLANLDPSVREALNGIEEALAPSPTRAMRRGRRQKPKITWKMITPEWIAGFEKAARDHAMRQRGMRP